MKRCLAGLLCLLLCISAVPVSAVDGSGPSPWAEAEVNTAISIGLVPEELQSDYQQNITRDEFAQLAVTLCMAQLRYVGGPEQFLEDYRRYFRDEAGNAVDAVPAAFSDATFWGTLASALGIVQGRGDGTFDPDGLITRQEAAVMAARTYLAYSGQAALPDSSSRPAYGDAYLFPGWAAESIDRLRDLDVMEGDNYGNFLPLGHLTREQAILIFLRLAREVYIPETGLVPYEEELTRALDGFTLTQQLESKAASALLGTDGDGRPHLWVVHGTGGRTELYGKLEEEIPGITAIKLLSLDDQQLTLQAEGELGVSIFEFSLWGSICTPMSQVLTPQPALDGIAVTGFDGTYVFASEEDGVAVYDLTGERIFSAPTGTLTWQEEGGVFRHESADGVMYYTSEGQPFRQTPWAAGTNFSAGQAAVQEKAGGPITIINTRGETLSTRDCGGGDLAGLSFMWGYVRLDKDGRGYLFHTGDASLFGEEYLDVGDFTGSYATVRTEDGWGYVDNHLQLVMDCQFRKAGPFLMPVEQAVVQWSDGTFSTIKPDGQKGTLDSGWTYLSDFNQQRYALGVRTDKDGASQATLVSFFQNVVLPGKIEEYVLYGVTAVRTADGEISLFGGRSAEAFPDLELEDVWGTGDCPDILLKIGGRYYLYQASQYI